MCVGEYSEETNKTYMLARENLGPTNNRFSILNKLKKKKTKLVYKDDFP